MIKNTRKTIGNFTFKKPSLVYRLVVVVDNLFTDQIPQKWREIEGKNVSILTKFCPKDMFLEEQERRGDLVYTTRYYTPESNILKEEVTADET